MQAAEEADGVHQVLRWAQVFRHVQGRLRERLRAGERKDRSVRDGGPGAGRGRAAAGQLHTPVGRGNMNQKLSHLRHVHHHVHHHE